MQTEIMRLMIQLLILCVLSLPAMAGPERVLARDDWAVFVDDGDDPVCWAATKAVPAGPGHALGGASPTGTQLYLTVWPGPAGRVELSVATQIPLRNGTQARLTWDETDLPGAVTLLGQGTTFWLASDTNGRGTTMVLDRWWRLPPGAQVTLTGQDLRGRPFEMAFSLRGAGPALRAAQRLCAAPIS